MEFLAQVPNLYPDIVPIYGAFKIAIFAVSAAIAFTWFEYERRR